MAEGAHIVILAPYCDATDVGESRSSFRWVDGLSHRFRVTLLTLRKRIRPSVVPFLPNVRVIEWDDLPIVGRFERFNSTCKPGFLRFHRRARRWLRTAIERGERIDLIHQLAPLAIRYPSPAVGLGIPHIVGPLAGSLPTPPTMQTEVSSESWYMKLRRLDQLRLRFDPWLGRTLADASAVIGVAPYVRDLLGASSIRRFECIPETALDAVRGDPIGNRRTNTEILRLLYVGRAVRTKGLRDAIRALARVPADQPVHLDAIGDGPDLPACRAEAERLSVAGRVTFHGRIRPDDVDRFYGSADAFVFPSFREPSGNVVFEALSHGLPVITTCIGGPGHVVTDTCGIRVPLHNATQFANDLARAMVSLRDRATRERLASGARCTARHHTWGTRIARMASLYESILHSPDSRSMVRGEAATRSRHSLRWRSLDSIAPPSAGVCGA